MESILEKAQIYGIKCHKDVNQMYHNKPYEFHLWMVYNYALKFIHHIPLEKRDTVLAGVWVHDCIEDCQQTYNDVKKATNEEVAELSYALTNEKGKTREERANSKYYEGIWNTPFASFIKICDRLANIEYSVSTGSSMATKYEKESEKFKEELYTEGYKDMFEDMDSLFDKLDLVK